MSTFDMEAFRQQTDAMDDALLVDGLQETGIVASDMQEGGDKALRDFIKFVALADDRSTDRTLPSEHQLSLEELLDIAGHLNGIIQVLCGESSASISEFGCRLMQMNNDAGRRRVL